MVPEPGDVIFAREGTVGTAVVVPPDLQLCLGQRVMIIRPQPIVRSDFLEIALNSPATRNQYRSKILGTTAPHLNVRDVKRLVISLPSLDEQDALVEEAKKHVSVLEAAEQQIMRDLNRTERLRKSILSAAFSGELVR